LLFDGCNVSKMWW